MGTRLLNLEETLGADRVITAQEFKDYGVLSLDPAGARNVDLPVVTTVIGETILIVNRADAAEDITLRLTAGGVTQATISQDEACLVWCTGSATPFYGSLLLKVGVT